MMIRRREVRGDRAQAADIEAEVAAIQTVARPLANEADLGPLLQRIGTARHVLLGEASHGTDEYYTWRRSISERLIAERGFSFIAVEGDWPDCYRINRYVKGYPDAGGSAREVLDQFERWPTWMWANWEVLELVEWLREYNKGQPQERKVGFYGLDVYSLWDSLKAVIDYLQQVEPEAVATAKRAFLCFEPFHEDVQAYARYTAMVPSSCEDEVVRMLADLRRRIPDYPGDGEARFNAEQNALVAVNAERYYRTMVRSGAASWNVRDLHMAETLERLMRFHGPQARGIVWAHNTHIGDARFTDMARDGMVNLGQIMRDRRGNADVTLVGFGSHRGTVIAARAWDAPMEQMPVPPAREGSHEDAMHRGRIR